MYSAGLPAFAMLTESLLIIIGNVMTFCLVVYVLLLPTRQVIAVMRSRLRLHLLSAVLLVLGLGALLGANIRAHQSGVNSAWGWPYLAIQMTVGGGWQIDAVSVLIDVLTSFGLTVPYVIAVEAWLRSRNGTTAVDEPSTESRRFAVRRQHVPKIKLDPHAPRPEKMRRVPRFTATGVSAVLFGGAALLVCFSWKPWALRQTFPGPVASVTSLTLDEKATRVACGYANGIIKLWNIPDDRLDQDFLGHTTAITSLSVTNSGAQLLSRSNDGEVRLWNFIQGGEIRAIPGNTNGGIRAAEFVEEGYQILTSCADNTLHLDSVNRTGDAIFYGEPGELTRAVLVPGQSGIVLCASRDGKLKLCDATFSGEQAELAQLEIISNDAAQVRFYQDLADEKSPLDEVLDADSENAIQAGARSAGRVFRTVTLKGSIDEQTEVYVTRGAHWVITHSPSGPASLWSAATGRLIRTFPEPLSVISEVCCSVDGRDLSLWDGQVHRRWAFQTGRPLLGHTAEIKGFAFTANGTLCATAGLDSTVRIWDLNSARARSVWSQQLGTICALAFTPDKKRLITAAEDGSFHVRDLDAQREIRAVEGDGVQTQSLRIAADGRAALFVRRDGTVRVCSADPQAAPSILKVPDADVTCACFGADSHEIVVGCRGGSVQRWALLREWPRDLKTLPEAWTAAAFAALFVLCLLLDLRRWVASRKSL
jgi:WD40 repeat protein